MSLNKLNEVINNAAKALHGNEKFIIPVLAKKAENAAQSNPHDAALVTASQVLRKMASSDKLFISRVELNKLYDDLNSPSSALSEVFAAELDRTPLRGPVMNNRLDDEGVALDVDYGRTADPVLANALDAAFDGNYSVYSSETAKRAEQACVAELNGIGVPPKKVSVFAGQEDIIVCQAIYETPKGYSQALVPVEIKQGSALLPTMFLSEGGFVDLQKGLLQDHVVSTAGKSFKVDGEKLLEVLSSAKNGVKKGVDPIEIAAMKVRAEKETPAIYDTNGILLGGVGYQKIANSELNVELPNMIQDPELQSFSERFSSHVGIAGHLFGQATVERGRDMLIRKLQGFGYQNPQISVADCEDNMIHYAVNLDRTAGLNIPVTVKNGMVYPPAFVISSGKIGDFTKEGLSTLLADTEVDSRMMAIASPMHELKASDVFKQLEAALNEGNLVKAEDAITVLGQKDPAAQRVGIQMMMNSLSGNIEKTASVKEEDIEKFDRPGGFITNSIHLDY